MLVLRLPLTLATAFLTTTAPTSTTPPTTARSSPA